jgi:hypothetical protein
MFEFNCRSSVRKENSSSGEANIQLNELRMEDRFDLSGYEIALKNI